VRGAGRESTLRTWASFLVPKSVFSLSHGSRYIVLLLLLLFLLLIVSPPSSPRRRWNFFLSGYSKLRVLFSSRVETYKCPGLLSLHLLLLLSFPAGTTSSRRTVSNRSVRELIFPLVLSFIFSRPLRLVDSTNTCSPPLSSPFPFSSSWLVKRGDPRRVKQASKPPLTLVNPHYLQRSRR